MPFSEVASFVTRLAALRNAALLRRTALGGTSQGFFQGADHHCTLNFI
jgi:hypothetical protein